MCCQDLLHKVFSQTLDECGRTVRMQDWHGVQAYVPFMEALHTQWTDSSHEPSLQKRTLDLISVPIHPSLDFLTQFGSGKKKRPWGQLRLAYKPVVKKNGQQCALRDKAFRSVVVSLHSMICHWFGHSCLYFVLLMVSVVLLLWTINFCLISLDYRLLQFLLLISACSVITHGECFL